MTFNLLNTSIFDSTKNVSTLSDRYSNLSSGELNKLEYAGLISAAQAGAARANAALPAGLPSTAAKALTKAGISAATTAIPANANTKNILVKGDSSSVSDNRLRLSAIQGREGKVYGPNDRTTNILAPLYATGGLMFPYTPSIQVGGETDWTAHTLTHTNYDIYSYQRTPSATISLSGKFTVQNQREGEYALACIHFLRTVGKMFYGEQDSSDYNPQQTDQTASNAGLPPPVLRLRGYGDYMFNNLRCVLKGYNYTYDENMDLVEITSPAGGTVMLPPMFSISVSVLLQPNAQRLRKEFKLDDFRTGELLKRSSLGGWF